MDTRGRASMLEELMEPFIRSISPTKEQREQLQEIMKIEAEGILAWGIRSGYFLWVREHPGETPTREQAIAWHFGDRIVQQIAGNEASNHQ